MEIACLSHLGLLASTRSFARARARCEEALRRAEAHGWATDPVAGTALASLASMDAAQGRFEDARDAARAGGAAPPRRARPGRRHAPPLRPGRPARGRGPARRGDRGVQAGGTTPVGPRDAARPDGSRPGVHRAGAAPRRRRRRPRARRSRSSPTTSGPEPRRASRPPPCSSPRTRQPRRSRRLDESLPGPSRCLRIGTVVQALVLAAAAQDQLGDVAKAEDLVERALDLAEADGLVLPFLVTPAPRLPELLERHPRHRTAHAALLSDLIDVLRGSGPAISGRAGRRPSRRSSSSSELRVLRYLPSNLSASEIAAEPVPLDEHGQDPHAPHLRQARRPSPDRGRRARTRARAARPIRAAASLRPRPLVRDRRRGRPRPHRPETHPIRSMRPHPMAPRRCGPWTSHTAERLVPSGYEIRSAGSSGIAS